MKIGPMAAAPDYSLVAFNDMARASRANDADAFNAAVAGYLFKLGEHGFTSELRKARSERTSTSSNRSTRRWSSTCARFCWCWRIGSGRRWEWLRVTAVGLVVLALLVHTEGLLFRMILEGRPPVTNLYSSAIFIGWGATVLGLILEKLWRNSIGIMVSCIIGFLTLIIAHHLRLNGDTMEMMRAVLDTNFWLATHVVVVTLGYASTFVAGVLGILYIVLGLFTKKLSASLTKDQATGGRSGGGSAGRWRDRRGGGGRGGAQVRRIGRQFWPEFDPDDLRDHLFRDVVQLHGHGAGRHLGRPILGPILGLGPKENGALIIVLWNALVLHARWGGLVRDRGMANLAVVGNIVTSWSWFGVNMLGIGLHSYGFTSAAFLWLVVFVASQSPGPVGLAAEDDVAEFSSRPQPTPAPGATGALRRRPSGGAYPRAESGGCVPAGRSRTAENGKCRRDMGLIWGRVRADNFGRRDGAFLYVFDARAALP